MTVMSERVEGELDVLDVDIGYPEMRLPGWIHAIDQATNLKSVSSMTPARLARLPGEVKASFVTAVGGFSPETTPSVEGMRLFSNASIAICHAIHGSTEAGGTVLVPQPTFFVYSGFAKSIGREVRYMPDFITQDGGIDEAILTPYLEESPAVLALPSPGNPSGKVMSQKAVSRLVELADKHSVAIIMDEVFEQTATAPDRFGVPDYGKLEVATNGNMGRHIAIHDTGKVLPLAGEKVAVTITSPENAERLDINTNRSHLHQIPHTTLLKLKKIMQNPQLHDFVFGELRNRTADNIKRVSAAFRNAGWTTNEPAAGSFLLVFPPDDLDRLDLDEAVQDHLLNKFGIKGQPLSTSFQCSEDELEICRNLPPGVRLSLNRSDEVIDQIVQRLN